MEREGVSEEKMEMVTLGGWEVDRSSWNEEGRRHASNAAVSKSRKEMCVVVVVGDARKGGNIVSTNDGVDPLVVCSSLSNKLGLCLTLLHQPSTTFPTRQ